MQTDAKPLYIMIRDFIGDIGISWKRWEVITTMDATTLRGSYFPHISSAVDPFQLPQAEDGPLDQEVLAMVPDLIQENTSLLRKVNETQADEYAHAANLYLRALSMPKQELLEYTISHSSIHNTGICGETANKLNQICSGSKLAENVSLNELIKTLWKNELPRIYAVVHIAPSHRFHIEKVAEKIFLLQSWVGRFSLSKWVDNGKVEWDLNEFLKALQIALPPERNNDINQCYSLLFNTRDQEPTPSAHTSDQVTCAIYQSADNKTVYERLKATYFSDAEKWK